MSRAALETFVRAIIDMPIDSLSSLESTAWLVARHGKLVLEEYSTASTATSRTIPLRAKSVTATLLGAAIQAGVPLSARSPVFRR